MTHAAATDELIDGAAKSCKGFSGTFPKGANNINGERISI